MVYLCCAKLKFDYPRHRAIFSLKIARTGLLDLDIVVLSLQCKTLVFRRFYVVSYV